MSVTALAILVCEANSVRTELDVTLGGPVGGMDARQALVRLEEVLDLLADLEDADRRRPVGQRRLLALSDAGQLTIMISPLSLVEVRGQGRASFDAAKDKQARSLVDNPRFLMIEFDREVAVKARDMVRRFKLKNFDAIHLASAVVGQADTMMTYDEGFPQGQSVDGVWVDEPYTYGGPDLFTEQ